jgi:hypothetical protein
MNLVMSLNFEREKKWSSHLPAADFVEMQPYFPGWSFQMRITSICHCLV